jgi:uncharacterized protein (TIGR02996 family)
MMRMMTERDLLAAIWAEPAAREPRVVYADYLQQQGDVRGEYMAIVLRWSEVDDKARTRAIAIEKKHGGAWLGAARPFVRTKHYDFGGMLDRVRCEADKFIAGFDAIVALGPRIAIEVTSIRVKKRETVKQLAQLDLSRVYELRIATNELDDKALETLAPALGRCKRFEISGGFGDAGLRALEPHVANVEHIRIGKWADETKTGLHEGIRFSEIPSIASKLSFEQPAGARAYRC